LTVGVLLTGLSSARALEAVGQVSPSALQAIEHAALRPMEEESTSPAESAVVEGGAAAEEADDTVRIGPGDLPGPEDIPSLAPGLQPKSARRRRDPFRPFTLDLRPKETTEEFLTPLQRYELQQLQVVGVLLDLEPPRAMVQDSSGMGYIVTPGTLIGRRRGVVTDIQPRQIVVEETYVDFYGREQVKKVVLEMPEDEESSR
jgi:type IV pilus assembly protein PilP